jgi:hypothetical protein
MVAMAEGVLVMPGVVKAGLSSAANTEKGLRVSGKTVYYNLASGRRVARSAVRPRTS